MATYSNLDVSPMEVISLLPFLVPDNHAAPARPAPDPADQEAAVSALVEYLTQVCVSFVFKYLNYFITRGRKIF